MGKSNSIRVLALGLIRDGDRLFVGEGFDRVKKQTFYRALGGGVDFGELSIDALQREFQEEIQADLQNIEYLGCLENIFKYKGKTGHELIQLYRCDFVDPKLYDIDRIPFSEGKRKKEAMWIDIEKFRSNELILYPEGFSKFL
ncbi:NUDIX hydrolase [Leptolyngbya valderiana BDU 20041]|nr:NUDIX hydrolase [Geitlerinema sp. CS-897]OAB61471.1 NUDIX hydrolase [Leptolyngbya valderiana BDU 20041]PPT07724.1 MutT/nudix family protein [Geitlerinema sp. FC II]